DGTWYFGNTAAGAAVQTNFTNCRVINVVNGGLVFSTQTGTNDGLYFLSGLPKTNAVTNLLFYTGSPSAPEDFAINAATNLAYVADDSGDGGIQRWQYGGGIWTFTYTLGSGATGIG